MHNIFLFRPVAMYAWTLNMDNLSLSLKLIYFWRKGKKKQENDACILVFLYDFEKYYWWSILKWENNFSKGI